tara:strand:+ start:53 stop:220 length:168 start_codon:yes stop_codon:yes gene_type:complete
MSKQKQTNGKGDKNRVTNKKKFDENYDKIFDKNKIDTEVHDHPLGTGFAHKDNKK